MRPGEITSLRINNGGVTGYIKSRVDNDAPREFPLMDMGSNERGLSKNTRY